ncbi:MAG: TlpA disulfide reductase family protein [Solirubrobacterales bacterium]
MPLPRPDVARRAILLAVLAVICAALAGCGASSGEASRFGSIEDVKPDLTGADPRLVKIYDEAGQLLGGGRAAYDARIASLQGLPIVVNKWGSWCGPCRNEFPIFQRLAKEMGGKIAFLGVNILDGRDDTTKFLEQLPVPFPSYVDQKLEISKLIRPVQGAPSTAFYTREGVLTKVKIGEYRSIDALRRDINTQALQQ